MPVKQSGLDAESVVFVDAGNSSDVYQCVNFARQFGLEIQKVLRGIVVSRAFTIHQLAALVAHELPKAMWQFNAKLVVVSDLLRMFTEDPQVSRKEARYLINEIVESVHKIDDGVCWSCRFEAIHSTTAKSYSHLASALKQIPRTSSCTTAASPSRSQCQEKSCT